MNCDSHIYFDTSVPQKMSGVIGKAPKSYEERSMSQFQPFQISELSAPYISTDHKYFYRVFEEVSRTDG